MYSAFFLGRKLFFSADRISQSRSHGVALHVDPLFSCLLIFYIDSVNATWLHVPGVVILGYSSLS